MLVFLITQHQTVQAQILIAEDYFLTCDEVVKNKVSPPFKVVDFDIMYGSGISKVGEILDIGVKLDLIEKSGAWFSYNSTRIGQGRENSKEYLVANPAVADEIEKKIRELSNKVGAAAVFEPSADEVETMIES